MPQSAKKSASPPTIRTKSDSKSKGSRSATPSSAPVRRRQPGNRGGTAGGRGPTGIVIAELQPINPLIPYRQSFFKFAGQLTETSVGNRKFFRSIKQNVKHLFDATRLRGLDLEAFKLLRVAVGDLKSAKPDHGNSKPGRVEVKVATNRPKSKRELLEEKRKALEEQQNKAPRRGPSVGMRIEIERLKKKFPGDPNLSIMSAILTCKDSSSAGQEIEDRVRSLDAALQEAGAVILSGFLTTYAIDVFFDVYFLYLEALRIKLSTDLKTVGSKGVESVRRDMRVVDMLLEQKNLGKSVSNIAKKLDGFGYPFEPLTVEHVSRSFKAGDGEGDIRIGPGTIKLNKFLARLYLNVFSQIPVLLPVARKLCEALPSGRTSRAIIANLNVENALIKFKLAKFNRSTDLHKMILLVYKYARRFIGTNFAETVNSPTEAKLLIRIAQMVEELSYVVKTVPTEMLTYGYSCATIAIHYYKDEAEALIRRISDIGAQQQIDFTR